MAVGAGAAAAAAVAAATARLPPLVTALLQRGLLRLMGDSSKEQAGAMSDLRAASALAEKASHAFLGTRPEQPRRVYNRDLGRYMRPPPPPPPSSAKLPPAARATLARLAATSLGSTVNAVSSTL